MPVRCSVFGGGGGGAAAAMAAAALASRRSLRLSARLSCPRSGSPGLGRGFGGATACPGLPAPEGAGRVRRRLGSDRLASTAGRTSRDAGFLQTGSVPGRPEGDNNGGSCGIGRRGGRGASFALLIGARSGRRGLARRGGGAERHAASAEWRGATGDGSARAPRRDRKVKVGSESDLLKLRDRACHDLE